MKKLPPLKTRGSAPKNPVAPPEILEQARKIIAGEEVPPELSLPADATASQMQKALYNAKTKRLLVTSQQHNEMLRLVRHGRPPSMAASLVGIPREEFNEWLDLGQFGREPYRTLRTNVEKAQAEYYAKLQTVLLQAMLPRGFKHVRNEDGTTAYLPPREGDPGIAKFLLERQFPEFMGDSKTVTVKLDRQALMFLQMAEEVLDPESYQRLVARVGGVAEGGSSEAPDDPIH